MSGDRMATFPYRAHRDGYRGSNPSRRAKANNFNRIAIRVESYINSDLQKAGNHVIRSYRSDLVAIDLNEDPKIVRATMDGSSHGIFVLKGDLEEARRLEFER